jgi:lipopolysaccharide biosynthesis regulator YciM
LLQLVVKNQIESKDTLEATRKIMGRQKIIKIINGCQNCHLDAHQIWWVENHGLEEHLETPFTNSCK